MHFIDHVVCLFVLLEFVARVHVACCQEIILSEQTVGIQCDACHWLVIGRCAFGNDHCHVAV
jgi:predicted RNA-binding Zn-ribbon protein involved in translation (DUF1610 family)